MDDFDTASTKMTATVLLVTPSTARRWLELNFRNRNVRAAAVQRFARDMRAGNWKLTGEPIKFDRDGNLIDGQHRLRACMEADTPFVSWVIRGIEADAQHYMDTGGARSAADSLALDGEMHTTTLSSAARLALAVEFSAGRLRSFEATHAEIKQFVKDNPGLRSAAEFASPGLSRSALAIPSVVAYTTWVLAKIDPVEARQFWLDASSPAKTEPNAIVLYNTLLNAKLQRIVMTPEMYLSLIYRTWNARRSGRPVKRLRIFTETDPNTGRRVPVAIPTPR